MKIIKKFLEEGENMSKINVLNKHIAELIAAGEVVERPSSVVKELVENAIDAKASSITVEIKNGGITHIRVTDDGEGIEKDDVKKAFLKNATSKILLADDLEKISTLGFRGEALASICAVSKVEIITKTKDEIMGVHYEVEGGEEGNVEEIGASNGTTIIVKDLFYNVPARLKFLKKDISESNAIAKLIDRLALSHPDVSFKFIKDGKMVLNTPGDGEVSSAIYSVYGKDFNDSLIPLEYSLNGLKACGYISLPVYARANRNMQQFFINGRYVKTKTAMVALEEAFKGAIMVQKFPSCVLYVTVPFDMVDVNVHPSKVEVRFVNEKPIFDLIYHGVKTALLNRDKPISMKLGVQKCEPAVNAHRENLSEYNKNNVINITEKKDDKIFNEVMNIPQENKKINISDVNFDDGIEIFIPKKNAKIELKSSEQSYLKKDNMTFKNKVENVMPIKVEPVKAERNIDVSVEKAPVKSFAVADQTEIANLKPKELTLNVIGEIFDTYIVVQKNKDEVVFIDKHAAHERLIYEDLMSKKGKDYAQVLLEPIVVTLSKDEYDAVINNLNLFINAGFDIDDFGEGDVVVRSTPLSLDSADVKDVVVEMATHILENKKDVENSHKQWLYQNVACRAAIKGGLKGSKEEMIALVKKLEENPNVRYCPHGRPVSMTMKKSEIEKQFGRM